MWRSVVDESTKRRRHRCQFSFGLKIAAAAAAAAAALASATLKNRNRLLVQSWIFFDSEKQRSQDGCRPHGVAGACSAARRRSSTDRQRLEDDSGGASGFHKYFTEHFTRSRCVRQASSLVWSCTINQPSVRPTSRQAAERYRASHNIKSMLIYLTPLGQTARERTQGVRDGESTVTGQTRGKTGKGDESGQTSKNEAAQAPAMFALYSAVQASTLRPWYFIPKGLEINRKCENISRCGSVGWLSPCGRD
jgi:hypothetical protein